MVLGSISVFLHHALGSSIARKNLLRQRLYRQERIKDLQGGRWWKKIISPPIGGLALYL